MGYACAHATADALLALTKDVNSIHHIRQNAAKLDYASARGGNPLTDPFEQVIMYVYGGWMFHKRDASGRDPEQVPAGDWNVSPVNVTTAMEDR